MLSKQETEFQHHDIRRLISQRNLARAQQDCLRMLRETRDDAEAHFLLGIIAAEVQKYSNAIEFMQVAVDLDSERAEYHAHLAKCLSLMKRDPEATAAIERAAELDPAEPLVLDTIGVVYSRLKRHEQAVEFFRRATDLSPEVPSYQFNLGSSLKFLGEFDAAENAYESAINASPRFAKAHSSLSQLRRQTKESNHVARLESLLHNIGDNIAAELHLRHALAKEYDDMGLYGRAFEHLSTGNRKKRQQLPYDIESDRELFDCVRSLFDEEALGADRPGHDTEEPIFIVGMPRTGTTLAERILTSHSEVFSAGELLNFSLELKRAAGTRSKLVLDVETLRQGRQADFRELGHAYLESTRPATGATAHFTDKLPLNFLYIGFIHLALPNAKIICLRRNPLDTCLSNFRQLFDAKNSYYNYAFDIMDTARYYVLFHRLMEHWHTLLPGKILDVRYEDVVADQETESRRIVEYCGLEWEEACLEFEKNTAAVATASSVQVRDPIYDSAVARWRRYSKQLQPVVELLEAEGIATG